MRDSVRRTILSASMITAFLTVWCGSAAANQITSATVSATCNGYTISVSGGNLDTQGVNFAVNYSITVTPDNGSPFNVSDTIPVSADGNLNFSASVTKAAGPLSGNFSLSGTATLVDSAGDTFNSVDISFSPNPLACESSPPPQCAETSSNSSNFNGTPIHGGSYIWFNSNFTASGIPSTGATITFTSSTISMPGLNADFAVPNAQITFSPSASCASTTFDSITNTWMTTVPLSGSDEIFLSGLALPVPAGFSGTVKGAVIWNGTFSSNVPGVSVKWKWGAAVYSTFSADYNALAVKATHQNACGITNGDHAGTPEGTDTSSGEPFKKFVIGGARGGGGSNFTGSWSGTTAVQLCP